MKPRALSVSAYNLFVECGHKFYLERILGISPVVQMSFLVFGTAVDKGCNALLANESEDKAIEICNQELQRLLTQPFDFIPDDYDGELIDIDEGTSADLLKKCKALGYPGDNIHELAQTLQEKGYEGRSENQNKAYSLLCHASLKIKAALAIRAYLLHVMPLITKVEGIQLEINWEDEKGNKYKGYLDAPVELKGHGPLIGDNKTSGNVFRDYPPDSVRKSFQLAIYAGVTGKTRGAYFVMDKKIKKNRIKTCDKCANISSSTHKTCPVERPETIDGKVKTVRCNGNWNETIDPECNITVVVDDIPEEQIAISQRALTSVSECVKAGVFPMNLESCTTTYGFGPTAKTVKCGFYDYCRSGSMNGLIQKGRK